jgi:phosphate:Na+ symporter
MGSIVLLDLMGGVALLLWGLHMVLTGVLRAFGPHLRRVLGKALGNRFSAFCAGIGLTALLQSSTATGLMTTSLAADGGENARQTAPINAPNIDPETLFTITS